MRALKMEMVELSVPFVVLMVLLAAVFSRPASNPIKLTQARAPQALAAVR
ncbi:MAG: hypothetical protein AB7P04_00550 [Bacteriovoracia bacterium]